MRRLGVGFYASVATGLVLAVLAVGVIGMLWTIGAAVAHASLWRALALTLAHATLVGAIALLLVATRKATLGWLLCLAFGLYAEFVLDVRGTSSQQLAFNLALLGAIPLLLAIPCAHLLRRALAAFRARHHA